MQRREVPYVAVRLRVHQLIMANKCQITSCDWLEPVKRYDMEIETKGLSYVIGLCVAGGGWRSSNGVSWKRG